MSKKVSLPIFMIGPSISFIQTNSTLKNLTFPFSYPIHKTPLHSKILFGLFRFFIHMSKERCLPGSVNDQIFRSYKPTLIFQPPICFFSPPPSKSLTLKQMLWTLWILHSHELTQTTPRRNVRVNVGYRGLTCSFPMKNGYY